MHIVIRLLCPPAPTGYSTDGSHLTSYRSMLSSILLGLSCADVVHIFSLYGMVRHYSLFLSIIRIILSRICQVCKMKPCIEFSPLFMLAGYNFTLIETLFIFV